MTSSQDDQHHQQPLNDNVDSTVSVNHHVKDEEEEESLGTYGFHPVTTDAHPYASHQHALTP